MQYCNKREHSRVGSAVHFSSAAIINCGHIEPVTQ